MSMIIIYLPYFRRMKAHRFISFSESSKDSNPDDQYTIRKGKRKSDRKPPKELTEKKIKNAHTSRYMSHKDDT